MSDEAGKSVERMTKAELLEYVEQLTLERDRAAENVAHLGQAVVGLEGNLSTARAARERAMERENAAVAEKADLASALEDKQAELDRNEVKLLSAVEQLNLASGALLTIGKGHFWQNHRATANRALNELTERAKKLSSVRS